MIGTNKFDDAFKNAMRDYFVYGFKAVPNTSQGRTLRDQWNRISKILGEDWEYNTEKRVRYMTQETYDATENPLNKFYLYHNLRDSGIYFAILMALSPIMRYRENLESNIFLSASFDDAVEQNAFQEALLNHFMNTFNQFQDNKILTNSLLYYIGNKKYADSKINNQIKKMEDEAKKKNEKLKIDYKKLIKLSQYYQENGSNIKNKLDDMEKLGLIKNVADNKKELNDFKDQIFKEYAKEAKVVDKKRYERLNEAEKNYENYWQLSPLTMRHLTEGFDEAFFKNFINMISFFAQYTILGEVGSILNERLYKKAHEFNINSVFRYRHNYIMESLFDYNVLDLLIAIEKELWCVVDIKHGTTSDTTQKCILPLEIRISALNGREHVMYYDPIDHTLCSLRIDFIDKITLYNKSVSVIEYINNAGEQVTLKLSPTVISNEIQNAKDGLKYVWGVDTGENEHSIGHQVTEPLKKEMLQHVHIVFKDDGPYLESLLMKQKRKGKLVKENNSYVFDIDVLADRELKPWVRSLYKHIKELQTSTPWRFDEDLLAFNALYFNSEYHPANKKAKQRQFSSYTIKKLKGKNIAYIPAKDSSELTTHGALFNALLSLHASITVDSILELADENVKLTKDQAIDQHLYVDTIERDDIDRLMFEFVNGNQSVFIRDRKDANYFFDLLPITTLEARWLKTIINDELATLFLDSKQLEILRMRIDTLAIEKIDPFDLSKINYYDRFENIEHTEIQNNIKILVKDIVSHHRVITFKYYKEDLDPVVVKPLWIEYSKRDHVMRLYSINTKTDKPFINNLDRIIGNIEILNEIYDYKLEVEKANHYRLNTYRHEITMEFTNAMNMPDRLLNEFSPWKKMCVLNQDTQSYELTIYYENRDEFELSSRLLSYGHYLKITSDTGNVFALIKQAIQEQTHLNQFIGK